MTQQTDPRTIVSLDPPAWRHCPDCGWDSTQGDTHSKDCKRASRPALRNYAKTKLPEQIEQERQSFADAADWHVKNNTTNEPHTPHPLNHNVDESLYVGVIEHDTTQQLELMTPRGTYYIKAPSSIEIGEILIIDPVTTMLRKPTDDDQRGTFIRVPKSYKPGDQTLTLAFDDVRVNATIVDINNPAPIWEQGR